MSVPAQSGPSAMSASGVQPGGSERRLGAVAAWRQLRHNGLVQGVAGPGEGGVRMATAWLTAHEEAGDIVGARDSAAVEGTLGPFAFRSGPALGGPICNVGASARKRAWWGCR
jgi:hypothetical protein